MRFAEDRNSLFPLVLVLSTLVICLIAAHLIAERPLSTTLWVTGGAMLVLLTFLHVRSAIYIVIFSMLLSPEIGAGVEAGDRPLTVRLEDVLLILVGLAWLVRTAYRKELGLISKSPLNQPILAYSIAAVGATLLRAWTTEIHWLRASLYLAKYLEYFVLYYLVLSTVRTRRDLRHYLTAALVTAAIVSFVGMAQIPEGHRVSAPFEGESGEPNTLGGYLVLMLSVAAGFYLTRSSPRERLGWMGYGALLLLPLLYTLSRSAWLATIAMLFVLWAYGPRKSHLTAFVALSLVLLPVVAPQVVIDRIEYTFNQPESRGQIQIGHVRLDTSSSARIESWKYGLRGWTRSPLIGYGVGGFSFMDAQYLRTLTEAGLVGLAAFCWLAWRIWRLAVERAKAASDPLSRALSLGYLAGYAAMLVHAVGANTFIIVRIMEPFWLLTALVVALPDTVEPVR